MSAHRMTAAELARVSRASTSLLTGQVQRRAQTTSAASASTSRQSAAAAAKYTGKVLGGGLAAQPNTSFGSKLTPQKILAHFGQSPFAIGSTNLLGDNADLATRAMTHESYRTAIEGHNRRLAFIGRRSLKLFTTLYVHAQLQASPNQASSDYLKKLLESPVAIDSILTTSRLGDKVGRRLRLEQVMRWTANVTDTSLGPRETGLLKVRGVCFEALFGAVYHERGAQVAQHFFTSSILPIFIHELFPTPMPDFIKQQFAKPT